MGASAHMESLEKQKPIKIIVQILITLHNT